MTESEYESALIANEKERELLELAEPIRELASFISSRTIFMREDTDIIEGRRVVRQALGHREKIARYYVASDGKLALAYRYGNVDVVFFTSDADLWLKKVSRGRCVLATKKVEETRAFVSCTL